MKVLLDAYLGRRISTERVLRGTEDHVSTPFELNFKDQVTAIKLMMEPLFTVNSSSTALVALETIGTSLE